MPQNQRVFTSKSRRRPQKWITGCGTLAILLLLTLFLEELPEDPQEDMFASSTGSASSTTSSSLSHTHDSTSHSSSSHTPPTPHQSATAIPLVTTAPEPHHHQKGPPTSRKKGQTAFTNPFAERKPAAAQYVPYPLRFYIYDGVSGMGGLEGREACLTPYSAAEAVIPDLVARSSLYTPHGELADYFIVPLFTQCFINTRLSRGFDFSRAQTALNKAIDTTLDEIQSKYPYWSRTEGRDHLFIFPTERGPTLLSDSNLQRIRKAIFIVGAMSRTDSKFDSWKDIVIPPARGPWTPTVDILPALPNPADPGAPSRSTLLHFRGTIPGQEDLNPWGVRTTLAKNLHNEEQIVFAAPNEACGRQCTREEMLLARYCLVPAGGVEGWSLRLYESLLLGCVPVIVADDAEMAFENTIDYTQFSVKILEKDAEDTAELIRHISSRTYTQKQSMLADYARRFVWHTEWKQGDAFDMLLRELHNKRRFMRNSPYRFWNGPVVAG